MYCHSPQRLSIEEQQGQALYSYRLRFSQVNNSPRANVFPAGEAHFGQAMYRSLERSTQDNKRDGFDLYSAQASFAWPRALLRRGVSRPFWIIKYKKKKKKYKTNKKILAVPEIPIFKFSLIPIDAPIYRLTTTFCILLKINACHSF